MRREPAQGASARGFRAGLRQRNPLVLVAAVMLGATLLLGVYYAFVSGHWSKSPSWLWLRVDRSESSNNYVAWTVSRLKVDPPATPSVFLLGGSTAREATVTGGESLAEKIARHGGPKVVGWNLASSLQTFAQDIAIVDNLPDAPRTLVIVGVSPGRFTSGGGVDEAGSEAPALLLWSDTLRRFMESQSAPRHWYTTPFLAEIAKMLTSTARSDLAVLMSGRWPSGGYQQHKLDDKAPRSEKSKLKVLTSWWRVRYPQFSANVNTNLTALDELTKRSKQRGFDVVIVELPRNLELIGDLWQGVDGTYQPRTKAIAAEYGVPYLDFNRDLALPSSDFSDYAHLRSSGRGVWEDALAKRLAGLYRRGVIGGEGG